MGATGGERAGLIADATGFRRFAVLAALLSATWVAMVVMGTFVGCVTCEATNLMHRNGPFNANATLGVSEHFIGIWSGSMWDLLREYGGHSSTTLTVLLWLATMMAIAGGIMLAAPIVGVRLRRDSGVPLRWAIVGGGMLGGGLGVGCVLTLLDIIRIAAWSSGGNDPIPGSPTVGWILLFLLVATWIGIGAIWAWALRQGGVSGNPSRVGRFVRWLFAGSCVELALAAPTFAVAARRESCFCSLFSWFAILVGTVVLTVLCGPMLVLLRTREARLQWIRRACGQCGYPVRTGSAVCPECGAQIRGVAAASLPA